MVNLLGTPADSPVGGFPRHLGAASNGQHFVIDGFHWLWSLAGPRASGPLMIMSGLEARGPARF